MDTAIAAVKFIMAEPPSEEEIEAVADAILSATRDTRGFPPVNIPLIEAWVPVMAQAALRAAFGQDYAGGARCQASIPKEEGSIPSPPGPIWRSLSEN